MQRLKTRAQFQAVMAGTTVSRTPHFALHRSELRSRETPRSAGAPDGTEPSSRQALFGVDDVWVGALLPKRWARRAVTRNAIKRQIYIVCDAYALQMPRAAHVVRLRSAFDRKAFVSATSTLLKQAVRDELERLVRQASSAVPAAAASLASVPSPHCAGAFES